VARVDLPLGILDLLILRAVALEPQHGWGISEWIRQISRDIGQIQQGPLCPGFCRLDRQVCIRAKLGISANNWRTKYYGLTPTGWKQLEDESTSWRKFSPAEESGLDVA